MLISLAICEEVEKVDYYPRNIHRTVQYHRFGVGKFKTAIGP